MRPFGASPRPPGGSIRLLLAWLLLLPAYAGAASEATLAVLDFELNDTTLLPGGPEE